MPSLRTEKVGFKVKNLRKCLQKHTMLTVMPGIELNMMAKTIIQEHKGGDKTVMLKTPPHCFSSFTFQIQLIQEVQRQI